MKEIIGFIGIGVMGKSMAHHLLEAGHELHVYNRNPVKTASLVDAGATVHDTVGTLAAACDVVISMVGFPSDVEEIYFGDSGILNNIKKDTLLIDMTTSKPSLAIRIDQAAKAKGSLSLDAPVSGGDIGAREARLSIMVGGDKAAFERALPLFEIMGKNIIHQGEAGSGQHTKMCNQIAIASNMIGVCEALAYAKNSGLDADRVLQSISGGAAGSWSLSNLAPRIIEGDFAPGFFIKHFIKDMKIADEESQQMNLETPGLKLALKLYEELAEKHDEDEGTQALYRLLAQD